MMTELEGRSDSNIQTKNSRQLLASSEWQQQIITTCFWRIGLTSENFKNQGRSNKEEAAETPEKEEKLREGYREKPAWSNTARNRPEVPDFRRNGDHAHGSMTTTKTPHFISTDMHTKFLSFFSPEISCFFYGPALPNSLRILRREYCSRRKERPVATLFFLQGKQQRKRAGDYVAHSRPNGRERRRTDGRKDRRTTCFLP